jgi:hypothetical protein
MLATFLWFPLALTSFKKKDENGFFKLALHYPNRIEIQLWLSDFSHDGLG